MLRGVLVVLPEAEWVDVETDERERVGVVELEAQIDRERDGEPLFEGDGVLEGHREVEEVVEGDRKSVV